MDLLHGAGAGLERGERLRGRLAALQRDDLLLELELLVLELLNLLLVVRPVRWSPSLRLLRARCGELLQMVMVVVGSTLAHALRLRCYA